VIDDDTPAQVEVAARRGRWEHGNQGGTREVDVQAPGGAVEDGGTRGRRCRRCQPCTAKVMPGRVVVRAPVGRTTAAVEVMACEGDVRSPEGLVSLVEMDHWMPRNPSLVLRICLKTPAAQPISG